MGDRGSAGLYPGQWTGRGLLPAAAITLVAATLYFATLAPGLLWGDDAELQRLATVGAARSDAHGHPLWFLLARLIAKVPLGSIAWRVNLLSGMCGAIAVGVVYLAAAHVTRQRTAATLAALAFAVSHTQWLHAVRAEVYALFAGLLGLTLLTFSVWREGHRPLRSMLLGLLTGVAMLSHLLIVTALPGLTLGTCWCSPPGRRIRNLAAFACGWLVGLGVFLAVAGVGPLQHPVNGGGGPLSIFSFPRANDLLRSAAFSAYQFPLAGPWVLWGAWRAWRDDAPLALTLAVIALGDVAFGLCFHVPDQYVFYLPSYLVQAIFLAIGLRALGEPWMSPGARLAMLTAALVLAPPALYRLAPSIASGMRLSVVTPRTLPGRDNNTFFMFPPKNSDRSAESFARRSFAVLPESALVLADWAPLEPLRYLQDVEHERPDVQLVESAPAYPSQMTMLVEQSQHRPVFIADDEPPPYYDIVEIRRRFRLRPVGPLFQLVPVRGR